MEADGIDSFDQFIARHREVVVGDGTVRLTGTLVTGIEMDLARKISKDIKDQKFKVKVQIEGDKLRVSAPVRDELQNVIAFLKQQEYGIPLQYANYR